MPSREQPHGPMNWLREHKKKIGLAVGLGIGGMVYDGMKNSRHETPTELIKKQDAVDTNKKITELREKFDIPLHNLTNEDETNEATPANEGLSEVEQVQEDALKREPLVENVDKKLADYFNNNSSDISIALGDDTPEEATDDDGIVSFHVNRIDSNGQREQITWLEKLTDGNYILHADNSGIAGDVSVSSLPDLEKEIRKRVLIQEKLELMHKGGLSKDSMMAFLKESNVDTSKIAL